MRAHLAGAKIQRFFLTIHPYPVVDVCNIVIDRDKGQAMIDAVVASAVDEEGAAVFTAAQLEAAPDLVLELSAELIALYGLGDDQAGQRRDAIEARAKNSHSDPS